ncbi:MAG TPA: glycoside hydrolase family 172 protein [Verrucomicrobiae bacterium]|nr:glycoside hydrolase family 172 protein [Verrucomicrobiae bacterium]
MKLPMKFLCALMLVTSGGRALAAAPPAVTLESLLREMTNRCAVAEWPVPAYTCAQVSSHDPHKTSPADPAGWHANVDYGNCLRVETNANRREWVILDASGPGAITRIWIPLNADKDKQVVRFYFDGNPEPAIAVPWNELLSGKGFVRPPLAFVSWNETDLQNQLRPDYRAPRGVGGDLYLPIPFARGCKVTLDQEPFYYCINYRQYEPRTVVNTFSLAAFRTARDTVDAVGTALLTPTKPDHVAPLKQARLAAGETLAFPLPSGPAAVNQLEVKVDPASAPAVLRAIVLEASFDGEATLWCPLGEFFGAGARLHPVQDWYRTVRADGRLTARWIMPYRKAGQIRLKNLGTQPGTVALGATVRPWPWDARSQHFHASWHAQRDLKTRPRSDWNYVRITGQGVYAGDTLTVFSPVKEWYGEGDERIYRDGETIPSHIGTGTEDYYGYAWGMPNFFNSPFLSTPARDSQARDDWRGYTTDSRLRLLDGIPFRRQLQVDMEIWNWADTRVDYAVGTFWYARPGATDNRPPQPDEAVQPLR